MTVTFLTVVTMKATTTVATVTTVITTIQPNIAQITKFVGTGSLRKDNFSHHHRRIDLRLNQQSLRCQDGAMDH